MISAVKRRDIDDSELFDAYSHSVMAVVDAVGEAVVNLSVTARTKLRGRRPAGAGSGVLIAPDGYLLTNSHVVAQAAEVAVTMADGTETGARIVGDDPATDLALLHVEGNGLPFAELDGEQRARPGQLVVAMGNPLGFASTVSTGVVSAGGRSLRGRDGRLIDDVVQHTAPLNPGSSGGPLLDSRGRILGINTAIIAWSQAIGFAVPGTTAAWVLGEIMARGRVRRAWLGLGGQSRKLSRQRARRHRLTQDMAVQVVSVERGAPANKADVRDGDLIVSFDGHAVGTVDDLHRLLRRHQPGLEANLLILRGNDALDLKVCPAEL